VFGGSNAYLVKTPQGNVAIDTCNPIDAPEWLKILKAVSAAPVRYIIITHAHWDHAGGVALWKEAGTHVIASARRHRVRRHVRIHARRHHVLRVRYLRRDQDHLTVWIPRLNAAFVGDDYTPDAFPAIYTLRGTKPRYALDYVESLDRVLALKPELLLLGHGMPINGSGEIRRRLTKNRDAILYVHDAVVRAMNDGKDVFTLIRTPSSASPRAIRRRCHVAVAVRRLYAH